MTFAIDLSDGNLNRTIKKKTNDKTLIIILQSIKTTYTKCWVYDVKKCMENIRLHYISRMKLINNWLSTHMMSLSCW